MGEAAEHSCPGCGERNVRIWVVEDLDQPFGCTNCIRKRGIEAVEAPLAAREAWPGLPKDEMDRRVQIALSETPTGGTPSHDVTRAAAAVSLIEAAGRLLGRRRGEPPTDSQDS